MVFSVATPREKKVAHKQITAMIVSISISIALLSEG